MVDPFRYFSSSSEVTLRKCAAVHGAVHNPFNQERHLISSDLCSERRSAALAEWREVMG